MTIRIKTCAVTLLCVLAAAPATAMYRCGNVFQDRPCDAGAKEIRLAPSGRAVPAPPAPTAASGSPSTAGCAQAVQKAQPITLQSERATQDKQSSESPNNATRARNTRIVGVVNRSGGSGPEMRAGIEPDCLVEKQN